MNAVSIITSRWRINFSVQNSNIDEQKLFLFKLTHNDDTSVVSSHVYYVNTWKEFVNFLCSFLIRHECTDFCWFWIVTILLLQLCDDFRGQFLVNSEFDEIELQCFPNLWWCHWKPSDYLLSYTFTLFTSSYLQTNRHQCKLLLEAELNLKIIESSKRFTKSHTCQTGYTWLSFSKSFPHRVVIFVSNLRYSFAGIDCLKGLLTIRL